MTRATSPATLVQVLPLTSSTHTRFRKIDSI
uniref:Uncharacterized protein n=1 Tax=Anguilla anguilla TaxID=7936 RepID=A0A0E9R438_ANGAN